MAISIVAGPIVVGEIILTWAEKGYPLRRSRPLKRALPENLEGKKEYERWSTELKELPAGHKRETRKSTGDRRGRIGIGTKINLWAATNGKWKIRLDNAEKTVPSVWVEASVYAVGFVMLGWWVFQVPGAIAGASIGYFFGKKLMADSE